MALFVLKRLALMVLTALCLSFIVFVMTNLTPNLEKLAKTQGNFRMSDAEVSRYLERHGYLQPLPVKYGQWLGVLPGWQASGPDAPIGRCQKASLSEEGTQARYCGVLQGYWGQSSVFKKEVSTVVLPRLALTARLMAWVMLLMVPMALLLGVLAGMREGSRLDRGLSSVSILTTATPEYVSGVILIAVFSSSAVGLKWFKGSAVGAMKDPSFENFFLPVATIALYGMGYIARMTRASMAEVMTSQYIRTARLKGLSFSAIVLRHALRNALIAPFTVIMLQFPWLLNGVVIVEFMFNYKGFGFLLWEAAGNNDIDLLMAVSVISVIVVLLTQLISDVGYVLLNPRIALR